MRLPQRRVCTLASIVICTSALAFCLHPRLQWAQSRGGTRVPEPSVPPEKQFTGSYALLVGVSQYKHWSSLPGVEADLKAMETLFKAQGFEVETVRPMSIAGLQSTFYNFIQERGSSGTHRLVLYFAGHGMNLPVEWDKSRNMGYIVSAEAPTLTEASTEEVRKFAMPLDSMSSFAKTAQARHILFIFDSCFAGEFLSRGGEDTSDKYLDYLAAKPVRQFITAGAAGEVVPDQSLFRRMLERGLGEAAADKNHDGYVTGTELKTYLIREVRARSGDTQTPLYGVSRDPGLDQGDFIFKVVPPLPPSQGSTPVPAPVPPPPVTVPIPTYTPVPPTPIVQVIERKGLGKGNGITVISLPGGTFTMGSNNGDGDEKPPHSVTVSAFRVMKTEVTVAQYRACHEAHPKDCTKPRSMQDEYFCNWGHKDRDNHPINCVDWHQAKAFAAWIGGRLPTEAEWEYAARGTEGREYPWGNGPEPSCERAVMAGCTRSETTPVCSRPAGNTPEGLCDMAGSVWEWVEDRWGNYPGPQEAQHNPLGPENGPLRVLRGGSWANVGSNLRGAVRDRRDPTSRFSGQGFRVVIPLASGGPK